MEEQQDKKKQKYRGGAKKKPVNIDQLIKLAGMKCTQDEITAFFNLDIDTIQERVREHEKNPTLRISDFLKQKSLIGSCSLRRHMFTKAMSDSPANNGVLIFMAKNHLGMSDNIQLNGDLNVNMALTQMTPEQREARIKELATQIVQENKEKEE